MALTATIATTKKEIADCMNVREAVFIVEQGVDPLIEQDEHDASATHIVLYDNGKPIGAGRLRLTDKKAKIERVCIVKSARGTGCGKQLMIHLEKSAERLGADVIFLHSQEHASAFYLNLGYNLVSPTFMDAGIPHVAMSKTVKDD